MAYTPSDYSQAPEILQNFIYYMLNTKGRSQLTVENYYLDLRFFFRYLKQLRGLAPKNVPLQEIDISDVDIKLLGTVTLIDIHGFLNYIQRECHNGAKTRSRKVSALRTFFKYLTNLGLLEINPVEKLELPKTDKNEVSYLKEDQAKALLNCLDPNDPFYSRDYCILILFLNCGLRLSELTSLNLNSISENTLSVHGKGNKRRQLYLNDACLVALEYYLADRSQLPTIIDKDALFLNRRGKRLGQRRVQQLVTEFLDKAGFSGRGLSTHKLRHSAATLMYKEGTDLRVLQRFLGHESLSTTQIYTHVVDSQMEEAIQNNPLAHFKPKK